MTAADLETLARNTGELLRRHGLHLVAAESCTGGLLTATLTDIPGSSEWLDCGFVTYTVSAKQRLLGVRGETLEHHGAVSEPTAREMALGALRRSSAELAVSVTGIAGPGGGEILHPVGTVWFGWALRAPEETIFESAMHEFHGSRREVRELAVRTALEGIAALIDKAL